MKQENQSQCYYNLSVLYSKKGEPEKAQERYRRYLELNKNKLLN